MYATSIAYPTRNSAAIKVAARTAAVVFGLFIGTGSSTSALANERIYSYAKPKPSDQYAHPKTQESKPDGIDLRSPMQHLENIKSVLNLPVSETAAVFSVTRQSIYKWISGASAPDQENVAKIAELSHICDSFKFAGVDRPGELIRMKAFDGRSVLDFLKNGEDYSALIPALIRESQAMDSAYDKSKLSQLAQNRTADWKSSISIPFSDEA